MKIFTALLIALAIAAPAHAQTWRGASGGVYRIAGAKDCYFVNYQTPKAGNFAWGHYPTCAINAKPLAPDYNFVAKTVTWPGPKAINADGTCYVPATGAPCTAAPTDPAPPVVVPPPVVTPPTKAPAPPISTPQPTKVTTLRVVVVPIIYQGPANTPANAIAYTAYMASLPKVTQPHLQDVFAPLPAWWSHETYGLQTMTVTVLPPVTLATSPACNFYQIYSDAMTAAKGSNATNVIAVTPYVCWQSHMATQGPFSVSWGTAQDSIGEYAHELGHQMGLMHTARRMPDGSALVYGAGGDQMQGPSTTLIHWRADHKAMLGALNYSPCVSTTLPDIYTTPVALKCGPYTIEYPASYGTVWVSTRENVPNATYGGSDTTLELQLAKGQSWSGSGYTFTAGGGGQVAVVKPTTSTISPTR